MVVIFHLLVVFWFVIIGSVFLLANDVRFHKK